MLLCCLLSQLSFFNQILCKQHWKCLGSILAPFFLIVFRCVNYGSESDPIYFMKEDSEIQCWTYLHVFWSVIIALPNFVLWTIALPLILLKVLRKNAKNLSNPELYAKYSFVYEGLKKDKYYW